MLLSSLPSQKRPSTPRWMPCAPVVAVGLPPEAMSLDIPRLVLDGIQVVGSLVGTRQDLQEAFQFAAEGKVVPKVTMRPIEDINAIFKEMEQGQIRGRMVIDLRS